MIKYLSILLFLVSSPAWATWNFIQVKSNNVCSGTTCAVTVTSTGGSNLLAAGLMATNNGAITISSITGCSGTWTHAPSTNAFVSGNGNVDLFYCINATAAQTTITITASGSMTANSIGVIWEASSTGGSINIDSGATPSTSTTSSASTSPVGTTLNLSTNNHFVVGLAACANACNATNFSGAGCTNDLSNPGGDSVMHCISSTSGSLAYPATWSEGSSGAVTEDAAAFQEASGGTGGFFIGGKSLSGGKSIQK